MKRVKRVFVVTNGCFSMTDANGRTLAKLFGNYDSSLLAQFYTYGTPDFSVCKNYYKVTDKDALKSFIKLREHGSVVKENDINSVGTSGSVKKKMPKTPFKMLLRELVWKWGRWCGKRFWAWLDEFKPEEVVVFVANNSFCPNLARKAAKRYNIPITVYTTEDYYFKDFNYLTRKPSFFYRIYKAVVTKGYKRMNKYVKQGFFNTPKLTKMFQEEFGYPCNCCFSRSDIDFVDKTTVSDTASPRVSYLGNLSLNRHLALSKIAERLAAVVPSAKLAVYGRATEEISEFLEKDPNIDYKGFVSYEDVTRIIHESDLVVHAEYDDPFYTKDLAVAFSTKIADSVCSGTPLLVFANQNLAVTEFLNERKCAFVASNECELEEMLRNALVSDAARREVVNNAIKVREECFTAPPPFEQCFNME